MGYQNIPFRDEDGEPLMDFEEAQQHFLTDEDIYNRRVYSDSKRMRLDFGLDDADKEDDEIIALGKKKRKTERSAAEVALWVVAELEVAAEEDAELNRRGKPAIAKLKKLSRFTSVLSKKQLQREFLDHGVLSLLKNWLEPLPDGSLPNINVRAAVLQVLDDLPIDLRQRDRIQQLKRSGLGKVVMFLSKSEEETAANRKLAKELLDKWSRPIFNRSTRFEDLREERVLQLHLGKHSQGCKFSESWRQQHASTPEAMSKVEPETARARAKQHQHRVKIYKKLQQLKALNRRHLQATKLSVEGRGMFNYL